MSEVEAIREELEEARSALLSTVAALSHEQFVRRPDDPDENGERWAARDILWHIGLVEDWLRRAVDQRAGGREISAFQSRNRPAIANTAGYLTEWLEQVRRTTRSVLQRMRDDQLRLEMATPDGEARTLAQVLPYIARHDREHLARIESLAQLPPAPER